MKIKDGFELRDVCGEKVVVAHGYKNIDFSKIIDLNESAAVLWEAVLGKDFGAEELANILMEHYEVERSVALTDAIRVMKEWQEIGLTE